MKFRKFLKKFRTPSIKIPKSSRERSSKSLYLRRPKNKIDVVQDVSKKDRVQAVRAILLGKVLRHARKNGSLSKSILVPRVKAVRPNLDVLAALGGDTDHCRQRLERRAVLFAVRVAGPGLRRSPGQGGSYRPSEGPCERRI